MIPTRVFVTVLAALVIGIVLGLGAYFFRDCGIGITVNSASAQVVIFLLFTGDQSDDRKQQNYFTVHSCTVLSGETSSPNWAQMRSASGFLTSLISLDSTVVPVCPYTSQVQTQSCFLVHENRMIGVRIKDNRVNILYGLFSI